MKTALLQIFLLLSSFFVSGQNVGINNPNPLFPLTFNNAIGDKISLWTDGTPTHYGFGIQSSLLQIFAKTSLDNIGFGYGSSSSFAERVRIVNNGETGMIVNGRLLLTNGTIPLNTDYGAGMWLYKADNTGILGFIGVQDNQNLGFYGGPLGWGLTYDAINSRVGIGTSNPNAPLGFPPALGKKITLYPGATGDVGMAVMGNLFQIYSDNPNADIAFGYDQGGTVTERMRIKGNGNIGIGTTNPQYPLDINGSIRLSGALNMNNDPGLAGEILVSTGAGTAPAWRNPAKPYAFTIVPSLFSSLDGALLFRDIDGLNNQLFTLNQTSTVIYTLTIPCESPGSATVDSKGFVVVEILPNGSSTRVSYASSEYYIRQTTGITQTVSGIAMNLPTGTYVIKARLVRLSPLDGNVNVHASFTPNEQGIQFIAQVLPT